MPRQVWLMRQAGRYLPEYRALKEKYSFLELCSDPELAAEVTLQPIRRYGMDIAIIFADILLPLQGMGINLDFVPGPKIFNPIKAPEDIAALKTEAGRSQKYVPDAIRLVRKEHQTVFGFCGSPFTLACYLMDPGKYKHFQNTVIFARKHPGAYAELMNKLINVLSDYLNAQLEAGAERVQIFDSWGGILNNEDYENYSFQWTEKLIENVEGKVTLYCGQGQHLLNTLFQTGAEMISLDWRVDIKDAVSRAKKSGKGIQGNLDPTVLFESPEVVRQKTKAMISAVPEDVNYIVNLGHGVLQETPLESVKAFVDTAKS